MCNCSRGAAQKAQAQPKTQYKVSYPDGSYEIKESKVAAQLAASKVTGATYAPA